MRKIAIHSVPRSGSTWLGEIFNSHPKVNYNFQPLFSYAYKDYLQENSTAQEIDSFYNKLLHNNDAFIKQTKAREQKELPKFNKDENISHIAYKEVRYHHIIENLLEKDSEIKVVGLIRNPFAVINSWLKAPKEFRVDLGWKIDEEWRFAPRKNLNKKEEFNGFEKWKEVYFLFQKLQNKYPDRFLKVSYEELITNPHIIVENIFNFAQLNMDAQTIEFLNNEKEKKETGSYTVDVDKRHDINWKTELPEYIVQEMSRDLQKEKIFEYLPS